jgi:hypothetical protein
MKRIRDLGIFMDVASNPMSAEVANDPASNALACAETVPTRKLAPVSAHPIPISRTTPPEFSQPERLLAEDAA